MPSPFPGMDPYIEACHLWDDFHFDHISEIKNQLAPLLPARYVVRAGERTYMTLTAKNGVEEFGMQSDVSVKGVDGGAPSKHAPADADGR